MLHDTRRTALALWLFACAVRLLAVLVWGDPNIRGVDQTEYLALAQNLRLHGAFSYGAPHHWGDPGVLNSPGPYAPTAARAPLYPAMIALLWWSDVPPLPAIWLVQALLGGFVALFVYQIARNVFDPVAALLAGLAAALAPLSTYIVSAVLADTLFCFLLTCGVWLWDRQRDFMAGVTMGAAILTRAVLLPAVAAIGLAALLFRFNRGTHARIFLGALLIVAPWTARNAVTQHSFVPVATMGWGANLLLGTGDVSYGSGNPFMTYAQDKTFVNIVKTAPTEAEAESLMLQEGLQRIEKEPLHWLWVRAKQYPRLFFEGPAYLYSVLPLPRTLIRLGYLLATALFVALSVAGLWMARARWREIYHVALMPLMLGATCFAGVTEERYSLAMVPMMAVFAGHAVERLLTSMAKPREPVQRRRRI